MFPVYIEGQVNWVIDFDRITVNQFTSEVMVAARFSTNAHV